MNNKKFILMFMSGILALIWSGVSVYVDQHWSMLTAGLVVAGALLVIISMIWQGWFAVGHLRSSRLRKAFFIFVVGVLAVFFFVGLNYVSVGFPWRWDVTRAKQHTLLPSTVDFIQGLKQSVKFSALFVGTPPAYLEDLFKEYERTSNGKIKTEIIDPIAQIGYAAQFGNIINGQESKVVVRSGKERFNVDFTKAPLSEQQLTNAVVRVTREPRQLCFLTGHNEYSLMDAGDTGLTKLAKALADNNMSCREVMLGAEGSVPQDCDVLIVAGPHQDLTAKEDSAIDQYLTKGGDALFLIENLLVTTPDKPLTEAEMSLNPSLNNILNRWGVNVEDDVVVDLGSHAGDDIGSPATRNYAKHKALVGGLDYTFYVRPRMITILQDRKPSLKLAPIVFTASKDKSWAETDRTLNIKFDPLLDTAGPIPLAFVIMDDKKADAKADTRIIVFTDADFLTNIYIGQYSNAQMGLNVINWLADSDPQVYISPKDVKVERLDLTSQQKRMIAAMLFLMPLVIILGGIIVGMKR